MTCSRVKQIVEVLPVMRKDARLQELLREYFDGKRRVLVFVLYVLRCARDRAVAHVTLTQLSICGVFAFLRDVSLAGQVQEGGAACRGPTVTDLSSLGNIHSRVCGARSCTCVPWFRLGFFVKALPILGLATRTVMTASGDWRADD